MARAQHGWLGRLRRDQDRPGERPGGTAAGHGPAWTGHRADPATCRQGRRLCLQPRRGPVDRRHAPFGA